LGLGFILIATPFIQEIEQVLWQKTHITRWTFNCINY